MSLSRFLVVFTRQSGLWVQITEKEKLAPWIFSTATPFFDAVQLGRVPLVSGKGHLLVRDKTLFCHIWARHVRVAKLMSTCLRTLVLGLVHNIWAGTQVDCTLIVQLVGAA